MCSNFSLNTSSIICKQYGGPSPIGIGEPAGPQPPTDDVQTFAVPAAGTSAATPQLLLAPRLVPLGPQQSCAGLALRDVVSVLDYAFFSSFFLFFSERAARGGGRGGALPDFFSSFFFFPVQQTTSGIGHRVN